jgi:hypothetical protein
LARLDDTLEAMRAHDFISHEPAEDGARIAAGYPDECLDFTAFAGSLAALITDGEWLLQPFTQKRLAIVVDFASETQAEAEDSLKRGWNGAWEFPTGCVNTVRSRVETNEQNARLERHLSLIATGDTMREFFWGVTEKLIDANSCREPTCAKCTIRFARDLAMTLSIFSKTGFRTIHLFSRWQPSAELRAVLREEDVEIQWNPLASIPSPDLEANRQYSIWDGTATQYDDFMRHFWAPSWQRSDAGAQCLVAGLQGNALDTAGIRLPSAKRSWRGVKRFGVRAVYNAGDPSTSARGEAGFVERANPLCALLLRAMRSMTTDSGAFSWLLVPGDIAPGTFELNADFDAGNPAARSLWKAWRPCFLAALRFASVGQQPGPRSVPAEGGT